MGYSISVQFKNQEQCDDMKQFLLYQQPLLDKLKDNSFDVVHSNIVVDGAELSYSTSSPHTLGFYGTGIPHYLWAICAWMSFKNDIKNFKDQYVFYYDDEPMYAEIGSSQSETQHFIINEDGLPVVRKTTDPLFMKALKKILKYDSISKKEQELISQLNEEWVTYKFNKNASELNQEKKKNSFSLK